MIFQRLPLDVKKHSTETFTGFLSRLASAHGLRSLRMLCHLAAIPVTALRRDDGAVSETVSKLSGLDVGELEAFKVKRTAKFRGIGTVELTRSFTVDRTFRYCPHCVVEDIEKGAGRIDARPWERAAWRCTAVEWCVDHGTELVSSDPVGHPSKDIDYSRFIRENLAEVRRRAELPAAPDLHDFDRYAVARLNGEKTASGCLERYPYHVSIQLCEAVGTTELLGYHRKPWSLTEGETRAARREGYELLSKSEHGLETYFDTRRAEQRLKSGKFVTYGAVYRLLKRCVKDDAYSGLIADVRRHAITSLALGPGDEFLGPVDVRITHSVTTASREYRTDYRRVRKILRNAAVISEDHKEWNNKSLVFSAAEAEAAMRREIDGISAKSVRELVGIHERYLGDLAAKGDVRRTLHADGRHCVFKYSRCDVVAFFDSVCPEKTSRIVPGSFVPVGRAAAILRVSLIDILLLVRERKLLKVRRLSGPRTCESIYVDKNEVLRWRAKPPDSPLLTLQQVEDILGTSTRTVAYLLEHGHLKSTPVKLTREGPSHARVKRIALDAFMVKYISLYQYSLQRGLHIGTARRQLEHRGIQPAIDPPPNISRFYLRSDLS